MPLSLAKTPRDHRLWRIAVKTNTNAVKHGHSNPSWVPVINVYEKIHKKRKLYHKILPDMMHEALDLHYPPRYLTWIDESKWKTKTLAIDQFPRIKATKKHISIFTHRLQKNVVLLPKWLPAVVMIGDRKIPIHNQAAIVAAHRLGIPEMQCVIIKPSDPATVIRFLRLMKKYRKREWLLERQKKRKHGHHLHPLHKAVAYGKPVQYLNGKPGHWITSGHQHLFIDKDGMIGAGPEELMGKPAAEVWHVLNEEHPHLHQDLEQEHVPYSHNLETGETGIGSGSVKRNVDGMIQKGNIAIDADPKNRQKMVLANISPNELHKMSGIGVLLNSNNPHGAVFRVPLNNIVAVTKKFTNVSISPGALKAYHEYKNTIKNNIETKAENLRKQEQAKAAGKARINEEKLMEELKKDPEKLKRYLDRKAQDKEVKELVGKEDAEELANQKDLGANDTRTFKLPSGMNIGNLRNGNIADYQKEGVQFALRNKHALLRHDVGLGKTVQVIVAAKLAIEHGAKPFMIFCPNIVKKTWKDEIKKFTNDSFVILDSNDTDKQKDMKMRYIKEHHPNFIVGNIEMLNDLDKAKFLHQYGPNVIVDEAEILKNADTTRSESFRLWDKANYKWMMSATPFPNGRPFEIWSILQNLVRPDDSNAPEYLRDWAAFSDRFAVKHKDKNKLQWSLTKDKKRVAQLKALLYKYMQIKTVDDENVKIELPTKKAIRHDVPLAPEQRQMIMNFLDSQRKSWDKNLGQVKNAVMKLDVLTLDPYIALEPNNVESSLSGKEDWTINAIQEHLKSPENNGIVVFCNYRLPLFKIRHALKKQGIDVGILVGGMPPNVRNQMLDNFNQKKTKVILMNSAGQAGLNLQSGGHTMIHMDIPWSPQTIVQREGRLHRQGQESPFTVHHHLFHPDSLDEGKYDSLQNKLQDLKSATGVEEGKAFAAMDRYGDKQKGETGSDDDEDNSTLTTDQLKEIRKQLESLGRKLKTENKSMKKSWKSNVVPPDWHFNPLYDPEVGLAIKAYRYLLHHHIHSGMAIRKLRDGFPTVHNKLIIIPWLRDYLPDTAEKQRATVLADAFLLWCIILHLPIPDVDIAGVNAHVRAIHAAEITVHVGKRLQGLPLVVQNSKDREPRRGGWKDVVQYRRMGLKPSRHVEVYWKQ